MSDTLRVWQWLVNILFRDEDDRSPVSDEREPRDDAWWQHAVSMSNAGFVTAIFWERIRRNPALTAGLNDAMRAYLEALREFVRSRNTAILEQLRAAVSVLAAQGIEAMPIKGAAYLQQGLDEALLRHIADIDLLVPAAKAYRSREILLGAGYEDAPETLEAGHHHLVPLVNPALPAGIDLHTDVVPRFLSAALSADEVRSRAVRSGAAEMPVPHPTDAAALSFLHSELVDLGTALWLIPLRQFRDLALLQGTFGEAIDWGEIEQRVARVGGTPSLRRYSHVYEQLTGEPLIAGLRYSMFDKLSYRLSLAVIGRPGILNWRLRAHRLSKRQLRRRYGISGPLATGIARMRETGRMLSSLLRPDRKQH